MKNYNENFKKVLWADSVNFRRFVRPCIRGKVPDPSFFPSYNYPNKSFLFIEIIIGEPSTLILTLFFIAPNIGDFSGSGADKEFHGKKIVLANKRNGGKKKC